MSSFEGFRLMEAFVEDKVPEAFQDDFYKVLSRRSPFANFKSELRDHPDLLEAWYAFKGEEYKAHVVDQLPPGWQIDTGD